MTPTEARLEFYRQFHALQDSIEADLKEARALEEEMTNAVNVEARKRYPRVKDAPAKWEKTDAVSMRAFIEPYARQHAGGRHAARVKADEFKAELIKLAEVAEIIASDNKRKYADSWVSTYSTQGFGAATYAKGAAERSADAARAQGLEVEVRYAEKPLSQYEVWVGVETAIDLEILRYKPGLTLRESVRRCWSRGVNPRVYWPSLPHGFEEREGLDFQGGEVAR